MHLFKKFSDIIAFLFCFILILHQIKLITMKKSISLVVCMILMSNLFSQKLTEKDVSADVVKAFQTKYAQATDVKWEKSDAVFKAVFIQNEMKTVVEYTATGQWIKTGWQIPQQYAPKAITDYLTVNYPKFKLDELLIVEEDKATVPGKYYVANISKKQEKHSIKFNLKGELDVPAPEKKEK